MVVALICSCGKKKTVNVFQVPIEPSDNFVDKVHPEDGYSKDGYNMLDYKRVGYDKDGYNKEDYDVRGYNYNMVATLTAIIKKAVNVTRLFLQK